MCSSDLTTSATGTACGGCRVEVYKAVADSFGRGVGQKLIGFDNAAADGSFNVIIGQVNVGDHIAGIAIDSVGNTSEFSPVASVTTVGAPPPRPPNTSVSSLVPLQPARLLETRAGLPTVDVLFQGIGPLSRGQTLSSRSMAAAACLPTLKAWSSTSPSPSRWDPASSRSTPAVRNNHWPPT